MLKNPQMEGGSQAFSHKMLIPMLLGGWLSFNPSEKSWRLKGSWDVLP
jgi:hypothetical protein